MRKLAFLVLLAALAGCATGGKRHVEKRERPQDEIVVEKPNDFLQSIAALLNCVAEKNT